jgi:hypothetical protein
LIWGNVAEAGENLTPLPRPEGGGFVSLFFFQAFSGFSDEKATTNVIATDEYSELSH